MVTYLPISSPFIRFASRYMDEAIGFAAGWNFFVFEAILVGILPFCFRVNLISSRSLSRSPLATSSFITGVMLFQLAALLLSLLYSMREWAGQKSAAHC
jgi:amino acid permease